MKPHALAIVAMLALLSACGGQSAPPSYPSSAAPAIVVIVDTDFSNVKLSVQDGDRVIAMMNGQHFARVSIRPGAHTFSAGGGRRGQGGGLHGHARARRPLTHIRSTVQMHPPIGESCATAA
jgi:hypothetical protein